MPQKTLHLTTHTPAKESEDPSHPPAPTYDGHPKSPQWKEEPGTFVTTCSEEIPHSVTRPHSGDGFHLHPPGTRRSKALGSQRGLPPPLAVSWACAPCFAGEVPEKTHTHTHTHTVKIYSLIKMQSFIIEGKNVQV